MRTTVLRTRKRMVSPSGCRIPRGRAGSEAKPREVLALLVLGAILGGLVCLVWLLDNNRAEAAAPAAPVGAPTATTAAPAHAPAPSGAPAEQTDSNAAAKEAEKLFEQGRDALFKGQYEEAIKLLTKAADGDPSKTSYRLHLARACCYAGRPDQAAKHLEAILKSAPDHVEAGQTLAEIYTAQEKWKDVVRVLEPLLKYRHDYPTYHMLAEAYYQLDHHDQARKHYEEAIKLNPQSATDHYQLGNIYLGNNAFARAAETYQAALRLGLDSPVLRYKLATAYFNLRNYFGSIAVQEIKSGRPGTISDNWYLIEPVPGRKDSFRCAPPASAVYQLARAVADGLQQGPDIKMLEATIYLNARRYAQAYEMFTKIEPEMKEDRALFFFYYAEAAFGTGRYDRYLELLHEAIKLDPEAYQSTLVDAYLAVADQYNQQGDLDRYIEYLVKAVGESPQTASLHLKLGNAYEEARKFNLALAQWRMVLDLEPDHPQRIDLLNRIKKYQGGAAFSVTPAGPEAGEPPKPEAADSNAEQESAAGAPGSAEPAPAVEQPEQPGPAAAGQPAPGAEQ